MCGGGASTSDEDGEVEPRNLTARIVMSDPDKYLTSWVEVWSAIDRLPDTHGKTVTWSDLQIWMKKKTKTGKPKYRIVAHRFLQGLCASWANNALDFAISRNYWPVQFVTPDGDEADMVVPFALVFWCCYTNFMDGRPGLHTDECQKVLQYLLMNQELLVKAWRSRLYFYSSATIFKDVLPPLAEWYAQDKDKRGVMLEKLRNEASMYEILSECIFNFIKAKRQPFPGTTESKSNFWEVPSWKRAMIFVFVVRHILDRHCTKQWKKFTYTDYGFAKRTFSRYLRKDREVMECCPSLQKLDDNGHESSATGKRKPRKSFVPTTETTKRKRVFAVAIDLCSSDSE